MTIKDALHKRLKTYQKIKKSDKLTSLEFEMCKRSKTHFINNWLFTYDPRVEIRNLPFLLFPFQDQTIAWIDERYQKKEVGIVEKSRDMGVSWIICAWTLHEWLFNDGFSARFGSRKEDLVDNKTMESLFGKIRYMLSYLPSFFKPAKKKENDKYLTLINPDNGNEIVGESANIGFGRGGRSSICFIDEFAHVNHSEAIWASIIENSDCIIPVSTPMGKGNQFAWLKHEAKVPCLSLHWSSHPNKNDEWYEKKKLQMKPWQVAQELDLSYETSRAGRVYTRFERRWHVAKDVIYCNPDYEQFCAWDFGIADPNAILWGQVTNSGVIQIFQVYELSDQDIDFHIPIAQGFKPKEFPLLTKEQRAYIEYVLTKVPLNHKNVDHYGDHAGVARTANSKRSCRDAMKEHGIALKSTSKNTFDWRIKCVDNLLKLRHNKSLDQFYSVVEVSPDCHKFIDAMFNYEYDAEGEKLNDSNLKPKHNWASHMVTAFEYLAINRFPIAPKLDAYTRLQIR